MKIVEKIVSISEKYSLKKRKQNKQEESYAK